MDWAGAIAINREALVRIVAGLVALLDIYAHAVRLPLPVYQLIARALLPVEAAVRRLIVIAARGLVVAAPVRRPMPEGLVFARTGKAEIGRKAFALFDTRKKTADADVPRPMPLTGPRIRMIEDADPRSQFLAKFETRPSCSESEALRVRQRLHVVQRALETLPAQARRMAQWRLRRAAQVNVKFRSPLRPGAPPGNKLRGREEIDQVLKECHALAHYALQENTS